MIDLHSIVAFLHTAKFIELSITHEINSVLGQNTINSSTVGKYRVFHLRVSISVSEFGPPS
jgi:hypothetical protein